MSSPTTKIWTRHFTLLFFSSFCLFMSFQLLLPIVPPYTKQLGGSGTTIGLVAAAVSLSAILMRFVFLKKMSASAHACLYRVAQVLLVLVFIGYSLSTSPLILLFVRFFHGLCWGVLTTLNGNYVGKSLPLAKKAEGFSYYNFGVTLALALGPFVALSLSNNLNFPQISQFASVFAVLSILLSLTATKAPAAEMDSAMSQQSTVAKELKTEIPWRSLALPACAILLVTIPYSGLTGFLTLYQHARQLPNVSYFFVINALFGFLVQLFVGRIADAKSLRFVLIPAGLSLFIGLLLLQCSTPEHTFLVYLGAAFFGMGFGSCTPLIQSWFNQLLPHHLAHVANFAYYNAFDSGMLIGSVLFGSLASFIGYANIYGAALLFSFLFVTILILTRPKTVKAQQSS